jgi:hypothetical protein
MKDLIRNLAEAEPHHNQYTDKSDLENSPGHASWKVGDKHGGGAHHHTHATGHGTYEYHGKRLASGKSKGRLDYTPHGGSTVVHAKGVEGLNHAKRIADTHHVKLGRKSIMDGKVQHQFDRNPG